MYFTREPVIETVVTSREGYKLTIRSAKNPSFEPLVVDALEVVSLGRSCFFRNSDRTKSFLLPISDYEVFEIRDARVNLKALVVEKGIKIAGGRAASLKIPKDKALQPLNGKAVEKEKAPLVEIIEEVIDSYTGASPEDMVVSVAEAASGSKSKKSWKEKKHNKKKFKESSEERVKSSESSNEESPASDKKFCLIPPPALLISEVIGSFNPSVFREEKPCVSEALIGDNDQEMSCNGKHILIAEVDSFDPISLTNVSCPESPFLEEDTFSVNSVFETDDF
ncbi:MAG: hypothetical protein RSB82_01275 [Victivallaceae bacterium]